LLRAAWVILPFTAGPLFAAALSDRSRAVEVVSSILLWGGWVLGLTASLVPRTVSLTVVRIVALAAPLGALWAAIVDAPDELGATSAAVAVVSSSLAAAAAFSPFTGDEFVNGSSYGSERRFALRVPPVLLAGPVPLAWAATIAGVAAGPLLLAARRWAVGGVVLVVGVGAAVLAARALHGLARRWVVFVPAGVVLHDPLGLPEPVLLPRRMVRRLGAARADTAAGAHDLTQRAPGLAVEVELVEPLPVGVRRTRREVGTVDVDRVLFTPTRPGAVVAEAARRRLAID
jgi:hypothetical protein